MAPRVLSMMLRHPLHPSLDSLLIDEEPDHAMLLPLIQSGANGLWIKLMPRGALG